VGPGYMAKCPAHDDRNPSLSLRDADGKILTHCLARCDQGAVISALRARGLWPEQEREPYQRIVAAYDYTDERGELLYQIVRREPKSFLQRRPDGAGEWIWQKHPHQVLYRLPEVIEAPIVFVVEGEKDVETLRDYGFVATCEAGGANAPWLPSFTQTLAGRETILIPDNDSPGWERAKRIARALLGNAALVRLLSLPAEVKDVSEWFAAGHGELEFIAMLEGVNAGA
jgi:putative DNA primase/helicase